MSVIRKRSGLVNQNKTDRWEKNSSLHHLSETKWFENIHFLLFFDDTCQGKVYGLLLSQIASDGFKNVPFCSADQGLHGHTLLAAVTPTPPMQYLQPFPLPPPIFRGKRPKKNTTFRKVKKIGGFFLFFKILDPFCPNSVPGTNNFWTNL